MEQLIVKHGDKTLEVNITARTISAIEKELGKPHAKIGVEEVNSEGKITGKYFTLEEVTTILKCATGVDGFELLDQNNGIVLDVSLAFIYATNDMYMVAASGNSESPKS